MIAALALSIVVAVRQDGPALTRDQARAMTPAALADALLAPGHPPIVEDAVAPVGMEAPPPPWLTRVDLISDASEDAKTGFCVKHRYRVTFPDLGRWNPDDPQPQPNRPDQVADETAYRLLTKKGCAAPLRQAYFMPIPADAARARVVVKLLSDASRVSKTVAPPFAAAVDDPLDREFQSFVRAHPDNRQADVPDSDIITDPRKALASLPINEITYVGRHRDGDNLLDPSLLQARGGLLRERWNLYMGGTWTIDLVLDGDKIAAMKMRNAVPPPF